MDPQTWQQLKRVFLAAIELAPEDRAAFLSQACADKANLRLQVERLLRSHDDAGLFLVSTAAVDAGVISAGGRAQVTDDTERVGQRIGPYEIIRELGHGGMGTVFLAVRADDQYRKQVAIKLVNRGMDTDLILRRFMMERQILANLEHPNIARLLEGGSTLDGLPYFVMEFIEGQPITEYCDARRLTTTERLELFQQVCSALQYAHQNLVVHRDIKPSNILVTPEGVPKLLDFGIAKLLSPGWDAETVEATASMVRLMTPEYASPEQLGGRSITTASDVYSLGIILYQLLSGHHPHRLATRQPEGVAQVILQEEPLKPSAAITRTEETRSTQSNEHSAITPESVGNTREGTVDKLRRRLAGDLDNIVLKALRKEPQRRYASVQEFSEDIRRHLEGLPVAASPDTLGYRARKFVQRNKAGALAAAAIVVTLLTATGITTWQARVARRERDNAQRRFGQVRQLANKVLFDYHDKVVKLSGSVSLRQQMIKDALQYLDNLAIEGGSDVGLQREVAAAYQKVGDVQGNPYESNLGDIDGALDSYHKALRIRESLLAKQPADADLRRELAKNHEAIGDILWTKGDYAGSATDYRETLRIYEEVANGGKGTVEDGYGTARTRVRIGQALSRSGDTAGALESFRLGLAKYEEVTALAPAVKKYRRGKGSAFLKVGDMLAQSGDFDSALDNHRQTLALWSALSAGEPLHSALKRDVVIATSRIASDLEQLNELKGALEAAKQAVSMQEGLVSADQKNAQFTSELGTYYVAMGGIEGKMKNFPAALDSLHNGLRTLQELARNSPQNADLRRDLALAYLTGGRVYSQKTDFVEAAEHYRQAIAILEVEPMRSEDPVRLAKAYEALGDSLLTINSRGDSVTPTEKLREARQSYQQSLDVWLDLRNRGKLVVNDAAEPDKVSRSLAKCDFALAKRDG
jgi:non-specific serine/threonine protein kinase/serine/threonine-protein kinase